MDFLVAPREVYLERAGKVQRVVGVKEEYFNHPDAFALEMDIVALTDVFALSHPKFSLFGFTEYMDETLAQLVSHLSLYIERLQSCGKPSELTPFLNRNFVCAYNQAYGKWQNGWRLLQSRLIEVFTVILNLAKQAQRDDHVFLVFGI